MTDPTRHRLSLTEVEGLFAVCKLEKDGAIPTWATSGDFFCITRTSDELSLVCRQSAVPAGVQCEPGWRCLRVAGTIPFSLVGVLAALVTPLAEAGVGVFAISTFDTDYLFVKQQDFERAVAELQKAGHEVPGGAWDRG